MDDRQAFEREIAGVIQRAIGPARPVDAMAVARAVSSQSPKWRFQPMLSATKFLVAGAVVALFGGFLLAGVLPQQPSDDRLPMVGASPSSSTASATETTTPPDVAIDELNTRTVAPGIVRVLGDGTGRNLDDLQMLFVASDGTVWAGRDKRVFRLGVPGSSPPLKRTFNWYEFSVSETGNLRARHQKDGLLELQDARWVKLDPEVGIDRPYPVHPDASEWQGPVVGVGVHGVWAGPLQASDGSWWFGLADPSVAEVLRHTPDGAWERLPVHGAQGTAGQFTETPDGTIWAIAGSGGISSALFGFDGGRWERVQVPDDGTDFDAQSLRLDGQGHLVVNGILFDSDPPRRVDIVREDSGWVVTPFVGLADRYPMLTKANLSLLRDDGTGWAIAEDGKFLIYVDDGNATRIDVPFRSGAITPGIHRYATAPDGSLWFTIRSDHPSGNSSVGEGLYAITPEAVAE